MNDIECTTCVVFASETEEPTARPALESTLDRLESRSYMLLLDILVREAWA
jgi:hypothetical protein